MAAMTLMIHPVSDSSDLRLDRAVRSTESGVRSVGVHHPGSHRSEAEKAPKRAVSESDSIHTTQHLRCRASRGTKA